MSGIFGSFFSGGSQSAAPAASQSQAAPTGEQGTQAAQATQQQQAPAAQAAPTQAPVKPEGLDYLATLFDNKGGQDQGSQAPRLNLTAEQLGGVAGNYDFSGVATPEQMQKLQSGDMSVLGEMFNNLGRQIYQQAMHDASRLTDKFVDARFSHENANFDSRVARSTSTQNVNGISDLHPMAQNMLRGTIAQLREANPQAPQSELENQAWDLLHNLGSQFDRNGRQKQRQAQQAEPDWDEYGGFTKESR